MLPILGKKTYQRFQIKNKWIRNIKPNYTLDEIGLLSEVGDSKFSFKIRSFFEFLLTPAFLEQLLKRMEKNKINKNPKTHQEGSLIYAEDEALIFLPNPHGPKIFEHFKETLNVIEN
jgi:hypothetical protein